MRFIKFSFVYFLLTILLVACSKDDGLNMEPVPPRDRGEQEVDDQEALQAYLETHFYNYEDFENPSADFDYNVILDTIDAANADKTPLIESDLLETKTVNYEGVDYKIYILKIREGAVEQPKFTDSTLVSYHGELLDQTIFDASGNPIWFDLTQAIPAFGYTLNEFKGASGFEVLPDNTVVWENDYGIGAVFLPSGLGYFSVARGPIPAYSPLAFTFKLFGVNEADHDQDGIPSWREDVNGDMIIWNDDTDGNSFPNYADTDDDGDFILTREEIDFNADGTVSFRDTDGDGIPDHLDPDN